jgi:hypothetical protein
MQTFIQKFWQCTKCHVCHLIEIIFKQYGQCASYTFKCLTSLIGCRTTWKCWIKKEHVAALWYQVTASMSITRFQEHHLKHLKKYHGLRCWMPKKPPWKHAAGQKPSSKQPGAIQRTARDTPSSPMYQRGSATAPRLTTPWENLPISTWLCSAYMQCYCLAYLCANYLIQVVVT